MKVAMSRSWGRTFEVPHLHVVARGWYAGPGSLGRAHPCSLLVRVFASRVLLLKIPLATRNSKLHLELNQFPGNVMQQLP